LNQKEILLKETSVRVGNKIGEQTCKIINFPKIIDPNGNLSFIEAKNHIPFACMQMAKELAKCTQ